MQGNGVGNPGELEPKPETPGLALKIGIAGALAIGAVASGFLLSRQGRRVVKEAWQGRRRTRLEDRVLEALWEDDDIGRRDLDVQELTPGVIAVSGRIRTRREREQVMDVVEDVEGVREVEDRLVVVPKERPTLARARARVRRQFDRDRPRG
jgi:hypothetical protein